MSELPWYEIPEWWSVISTTILTLTGIGISLIVYHSGRKHNELSVMPAIDLYLEISNDGDLSTFKMCLANKGLGPAIIEDIIFKHQGATLVFNSGFREYIKTLFNDQIKATSPIDRGRIVAAGEKIELFTIVSNEHHATHLRRAEIAKIFDMFLIEVVFMSMLGESTSVNRTFYQ